MGSFLLIRACCPPGPGHVYVQELHLWELHSGFDIVTLLVETDLSVPVGVMQWGSRNWMCIKKKELV